MIALVCMIAASTVHEASLVAKRRHLLVCVVCGSVNRRALTATDRLYAIAAVVRRIGEVALLTAVSEK